MARNNRIAFTLVEMLVVIVIISMLVALLVPAVIGARARARRVSCMNKMDQAGKAIAQYEAAKGYLPGYVNKIGTAKFASSVASSNNLSWAVVILEYMGRADLWKEWRTGSGGPPPVVEMPEYVCPSDTERRGKAGTLSFAANCGISDERTTDLPAYVGLAGSTTYDQSAWGLFFDHDPTGGTTAPYGLPGSKVVKIGIDEIADGATQTILLSENLDAGNWNSVRLSTPPTEPVVDQAKVGIVWWSAESSLPWASVVPGEVMINSENPSMPPYKARPSSNHPGGVNAVFADGHSQFISDQVDYNVFRDQMISDQAAARKFGLIP